MKNPFFTLSILVFLLGMFACGSGKTDVKEEELNTLLSEINATHDQLMPETHGTALKLSDSLKTFLDKVKPTRADSIKKVMATLDSATKNMDVLMEKMMRYNEMTEKKELSTEEKMTYLRAEKEIVINMKRQLTTGTQQTNQLFNLLNNPPSPQPNLIPNRGLIKD
ncbi:MAG: hypothetical protein H7Y04_03000 [Verrucomicrobia bacterium]|nr:hypothetical protein [Cytophagales bacterium]